MTARVVECTIQMNMVEGEDFNPFEKEISDAEAIRQAVSSFADTIRRAAEGENGWTLDEDSWVQAKITFKVTEDPS